MKRTLMLAVAVFCVGSAAYAVTRTRGTSVFDIVEFGQAQPQPYATIAADVGAMTLTQYRSASYFPVNTSSAAVDIEIASALTASDFGAHKIFAVATGHATQALTVSADGAGVTTVVTQQGGGGTTCEDKGDYIDCFGIATDTLVCTTFCAD